MMKRSTAGGGESGSGWGGQQSGKQKAVTAHSSLADHVDFIYVSEGDIPVGSSGGSDEAGSRPDAEEHRDGTAEKYEESREDPSPLPDVLQDRNSIFEKSFYTPFQFARGQRRRIQGDENWDIAEKKLLRVLLFCIHKGQKIKKSAEKAVLLLSYQKAIYMSAELKENKATCNISAEASLQVRLT